MIKVELTKSQVKNLADFIEVNLLDDIRKDESIDNIEYVKDLCDAHTKLKEALEGSGIE